MSELNPADEETVRAYRLAFGTPAGQAVLLDLMRFCKFRTNCETREDEGGRRVFVRIMNFLAFTPEQLKATYSGKRQFGESDDGDYDTTP